MRYISAGTSFRSLVMVLVRSGINHIPLYPFEGNMIIALSLRSMIMGYKEGRYLRYLIFELVPYTTSFLINY